MIIRVGVKLLYYISAHSPVLEVIRAITYVYFHTPESGDNNSDECYGRTVIVDLLSQFEIPKHRESVATLYGSMDKYTDP